MPDTGSELSIDGAAFVTRCGKGLGSSRSGRETTAKIVVVDAGTIPYAIGKAVVEQLDRGGHLELAARSERNDGGLRD